MIFSNPGQGKHQYTLAAPVDYTGVGLLGGKRVSMTLLPAAADQGIRFWRYDVDPERAEIVAKWQNVVDNGIGTVLGNDHEITVSGVETLLAALRGCGVDNAIIEINGDEVPVLDGSCAPIMAMINRIGLQRQNMPRLGLWIERPIEVRLGERYAILNPSSIPRISVNLEFRDPTVEPQCLSLEMIDHVFEREIAPARALGLAGLVDPFNAEGQGFHDQPHLTGLIDDRIDLGKWRLRYHDEFARYKMLECFGDLTLAGAAIFGHLFVHQPSHRLNRIMLRELFANRQSWGRHSYDEIQRRIEQEHGEQAMRAKISSKRPH
jgi:UDP-3-O-[3-hydroxymyristoyl] N-acetylglucosamine deacetylase